MSVAMDALRTLGTRVRPRGEKRPPHPHEDFGYEDLVANRRLSETIAEAASHHRPDHDRSPSFGEVDDPADERDTTADARTFDRLFNTTASVNSKSYFFCGAGAWTMGARYSSGPFAQYMGRRAWDAIAILGLAAPSALQYSVLEELVEYIGVLSRIAYRSPLEAHINDLPDLIRPTQALKKKVRKFLPDSTAMAHGGLDFEIDYIIERNKLRQKTRLSPCASLAIRQGATTFYYGARQYESPEGQIRNLRSWLRAAYGTALLTEKYDDHRESLSMAEDLLLRWYSAPELWRHRAVSGEFDGRRAQDVVYIDAATDNTDRGVAER